VDHGERHHVVNKPSFSLFLFLSEYGVHSFPSLPGAQDGKEKRSPARMSKAPRAVADRRLGLRAAAGAVIGPMFI
jgi:hypothetical protein